MSRTRTAQPEAPPPLGKAARTRLRLVEAVRREIEDEGAISAEAVARRADSSPATFYNHFSSKDEAVLAAFDAAMADLVAFVETRLRVEAALEHGLTPFLRGWLTECVGFFRTNSLVFGAARALSPSSAELRRVFADRESEALVHYTRFVRLGQRAGLVRAGDPAALAEAWMLATQGGASE